MNHHQKCLLILGMHRSGTSVLSGCLHLLGAELGRNLMPSSEGDQSGTFENQDLVLIHDILLRDLGCRWDMVGSLPKDWTQTQAASDARDKIERVIERDFAQSSLWAVKDPRLCRLLPLWLDLLQDKGIHPRIAFMARHPYEVALSLKKRDGFDMLKGHLLWLSHTRETLATCRELDHCVLTYDQLLADPLSSLETVSKSLSLDYQESVRRNAHRIIEFVRPDLKRCTLSGDNNPFAPYAWLYDQLRLSQARALEARHDTTSAGPNPSLRSPVQALDMKGFPLMGWQGHDKPAASHASAMFENLLSIISSYEQADLNRKILRQRKLLEADQHGTTLYAQIYFPEQVQDRKNPYSEHLSSKILLAPGEWQQLTVDIPQPELLRENSLRLDPSNTKGMIRISALKILDAVTQETVWSIPGSEGFKACDVPRDGLVLDDSEPLLVCATGNDPQVLLPPVPDLPDRPLQLEVWIKVDRELTDLTSIWQELATKLQQRSQKVKEIQGQLEQSQAEWAAVKEQLDELVQENDKLISKWEERQGQWTQQEKNLQEKLQERNKQLEQWQEKEKKWQARETDLKQARSELESSSAQVEDQRYELQSKRKELEKVRQELAENQANIDHLHEAKGQLEGSLQTKEEELRQAQNALTSKEKELSALYEDLEQTKSKLDQLEQDLQYKDSQLEKLQQDLIHQQELSQQHFHELAKSEEENGQLQEKQQELQEQVKADETRIVQVQKDYDQAAQQLNENQKELEAIRSEKAQIQEELQTKTQELEQAQAKLNSKLNSLTEAREQVQKFKSSLKSRELASNNAVTPSSDTEQLEQEIERLKDKLTQQEDLTRQYFTELAKAEEELAKVQN